MHCTDQLGKKSLLSTKVTRWVGDRFELVWLASLFRRIYVGHGSSTGLEDDWDVSHVGHYLLHISSIVESE